MLDKEVLLLAKKVWDYQLLNQEVKNSDCIFVLCSYDLRVADRAAELYNNGFAPLLIFSGKEGAVTKGLWKKSEAEEFALRAMELGVPKDAIIIENEATNTGENVLFTKKLLAEKGIDPKSFILVQKPFMERRVFATFKKLWPEKEFCVTSPLISFEQSPTEGFLMERMIEIMVGDLQRIKIYPQKGFQIYQEIPEDVWEAFERLVELGFGGHLIK